MRRRADNVTRVKFEEFSRNVKTILERVLRDDETVLVGDARNGVILTPVHKAKRRCGSKAGITKSDREAFL